MANKFSNIAIECHYANVSEEWYMPKRKVQHLVKVKDCGYDKIVLEVIKELLGQKERYSFIAL